MSAERTSAANDDEATRDGCELQGCFCPHEGLVQQSSLEFRQQVRDLLRARLRLASIILLTAFLGFLVRDLVASGDLLYQGFWVQVAHIAVTLVEGAFAVVLCRRCQPTTFKLRTIELVMFLLPAAYLAARQYLFYTREPAGTAELAAYQFIANSIPWIMLLVIYGMFIPNLWRRAAAVVALLALAPFATALIASREMPLMREALSWGTLSFHGLQMAMACVVAVYGSHKLGALRREAFDAKKVGVYSLKRLLGSGGMGEVYLAEHQLLKRPCAVKLIRPDRAGDAAALARFESEVQSTARLTHPNTVEIYDYGVTEHGVFFYVMEFLPGLSLQEIVDRTGPMPPARVVHLLRQVCSALAEAHRSGLIHRDIKPGNIFAAERGGLYDFAKLLDFGLVKSTGFGDSDVHVTREGIVLGSPLYSAPETAMGHYEVDSRTDIYSLGATAYFLLTGRPVFPGDKALQIVFAHAKESPTPLTHVRRDVPADLEAIVLRCLAKSPEERFQTVTDLEEALSDTADADGWDTHAAERWWRESADFTARRPVERVDEFAVTAVGGTSL
jgi:serine/threonine-protein kinase